MAREAITVEIVSADAMQLYRGMDIGTGKVTAEQSAGIPHHLLDVWSPATLASVRDYQHLAREAIEGCFERGVLPMVVGGSGLYYSSVVYQFDFPGHDPGVRAELEARWERDGLGVLVEELRRLDPSAAQAIDLANPRRVIRALEVLAVSGQSPRAALAARGQLWHQPTVVWGLEWPREVLNERINARVDDMFAHGLIDEVRSLRDSREGLGPTAAQAIGYREVIDYLEGRIGEDAARELVAQHTRRYARKQLSWFRRDKAISWLDPSRPDLVGQVVTSILEHLPRR